MRPTELPDSILRKAHAVQLVLTDCDGVLTDAGVYYDANGEALKRFSMRDGMGVERLRTLAGVDVGILTGEVSEIVVRRAEKLNIKELHLGCKDKAAILASILERRQFRPEQIAYIGDDLNDLEIMHIVGFRGCPADSMPEILRISDFVSSRNGGHGAFREFAETILRAKQGHWSHELHDPAHMNANKRASKL